MDWSDRIVREEERLKRAMLITCIGDAASVSLREVSELLAYKFDLVAESMVLHRVGPVEFLVFMEDEDSVIKVANSNNRPTDNASIRLHYRQWSCSVHVTDAVLPRLVDIDLHGVPAHAWEVSLAESLLNRFGWIKEIHETTRVREDYSSFWVKA